jgi:hypothetical protein
VGGLWGILGYLHQSEEQEAVWGFSGSWAEEWYESCYMELARKLARLDTHEVSSLLRRSAGEPEKA